MALDVVVLAVDLNDAKEYAANHLGSLSWIACTVRSPRRVRGVTAGEVIATPRAADHPKVLDMLNEAWPCVAATQRRAEVSPA